MPIGEEHAPTRFDLIPAMTAIEERRCRDSQRATGSPSADRRLETLGLVERVFGQALLTRLGRAALHVAD